MKNPNGLAAKREAGRTGDGDRPVAPTS